MSRSPFFYLLLLYFPLNLYQVHVRVIIIEVDFFQCLVISIVFRKHIWSHSQYMYRWSKLLGLDCKHVYRWSKLHEVHLHCTKYTITPLQQSFYASFFLTYSRMCVQLCIPRFRSFHLALRTYITIDNSSDTTKIFGRVCTHDLYVRCPYKHSRT